MTKNRLFICFLIAILALSFGCKKIDSKDDNQVSIAKLQEAANQGNDPAMVALGLEYATGRRVPQDYNESVKWYRKAAEDGYPIGQFRLGYCYFVVGRGEKQNFPEAVKWFRLAANNGQSAAQTLLGEAYLKGLGIEKDDKKAFVLFQEAALQGDDVGQYALGMCYELGKGTETNYPRAIEWFESSAKQGYDKAQNELGNIYFYGIGVQVNQSRAFHWYQAAALQGNVNAEAQSSFYYATMNGDFAESYKWITLVSYKDPQGANLAINILKKEGRFFSPDQILEGKQRAAEFIKTNQCALPSTNEVRGL